MGVPVFPAPRAGAITLRRGRSAASIFNMLFSLDK
jgi:hypothetical protein